jgi:hypothetical protein
MVSDDIMDILISTYTYYGGTEAGSPCCCCCCPAEDPAALRELNYAERRGAMYLLFCAEAAPCSLQPPGRSSVVQEVLDLVRSWRRGVWALLRQARSTAPSMVQ